MTDHFKIVLDRFTPTTAEQTYGELYQYCASDEFDEAAALSGFSHLVAWMDAKKDPLVQLYGLLILGGLIDCEKLPADVVQKQINELFTTWASQVTNFDVLDNEYRFVHFVSHFAYLAGSCCEQYNDGVDGLKYVVQSMVDLFLAAPEAYWCGEELLVARMMLEANLLDETFAKMLVGLKPELVVQDADRWDEAAVSIWKIGTVRENHKRQLVMALQGLNLLLKEKPAHMFEPLMTEIVESRFG